MTIASAAVAVGFPPLADAINNTGGVIVRPPPGSRVSRYWPHETTKANAALTTSPGAARPLRG